MRYFIAFILLILLFIFMLFFIQNMPALETKVKFSMQIMDWKCATPDIPLYLIILLSFFLGGVIILLFFIADKIKLTLVNHKLHEKIKLLEKQIDANKARLYDLETQMSPESKTEAASLDGLSQPILQDKKDEPLAKKDEPPTKKDDPLAKDEHKEEKEEESVGTEEKTKPETK